MIDFRYHLVSLVAVFLALAVGIVLGAGPLKGALGSQLSDQVNQLRQDRDATRQQLSQEQEANKNQQDYLKSLSNELVGGLLPDRRIAVVGIDSVSQDTMSGITDTLTEAGAQIATQVQLDSSWWSADEMANRDKAAGQVRSQLTKDPGKDATTSQILAAALDEALTDHDSANPQLPSSQAKNLSKTLSDNGLLPSNAIDTSADAVVFVMSSPLQAQQSSQQDEIDAEKTMAVDLAEQATATADGVVFAGPADSKNDPVTAIRSDSELADTLSTVDNPNEEAGYISVTRACAASMNGVNGQYGYAGSANGSDQSGPLSPPHLPAKAG